MNRSIRHFIVFALALSCAATPVVAWAFGAHTLESPDGFTTIDVRYEEPQTENGIAFRVQRHGKTVIDCLVSMTVNGIDLAENPGHPRFKTAGVERTIEPVIPIKSEVVEERYKELRLDYRKGFSLIFRAYNEGVAYRFVLHEEGPLRVDSERLQLRFGENDRVYFPKEESFFSHNERPYLNLGLTEIGPEDFCSTPTLVAVEDGPKILITESGLVDYPGLWLRGNDGAELEAIFPAYPKECRTDTTGLDHSKVLQREEFLAQTEGPRAFPWRVFTIADRDADLLTNQLVYLLAPPSEGNDWDWIEPGWVSLDWWGRRNIYGVDFEAGINTETHKYFVDFCAEYGIRYFLLDDGWSKRHDLLSINEELDLQALLEHARKKGVDIMLWCYWHPLDREMERVLDTFAEWGVKGIKIDFMQTDDQKMVNFYHRVAKEAAKRRLVIDLHGSYKPAGLRRTYPNVLTREGLVEFEQNGWKDYANPEHHTTLPFIRMVAGPMDFLPGTVRNAQKKNFRPVGERPMGLGTRAHSVAQCILYESPLQMLPDSPSDYYAADPCTRFMTSVPVTWHETVPLEAEVGNCVAIARRHGSDWYLGAITDWTPRELTLDLSFLGSGTFHIQAVEDGVNAGIRAIDHKHTECTVTRDETLKVQLAPGGGWAGILTPATGQP